MNKRSPITDKRRLNVANNDSFLEALRDLGADIVDSAANDVIGGIANEAYNQLTGNKSGDLKPNEPLDLTKLSATEKFTKEEKQAEINFQNQIFKIRQQERLIYKQSEQQTQMQIKAILVELGKLTQTTKNLAKEVEIAAAQIPVEPGVYHLNFFEKLKQTIILFRKRIEEAATWLMAVNQKARKRNFYWAQVRKSGSKFLLSQERYMSTQAG